MPAPPRGECVNCKHSASWVFSPREGGKYLWSSTSYDLKEVLWMAALKDLDLRMISATSMVWVSFFIARLSSFSGLPGWLLETIETLSFHILNN